MISDAIIAAWFGLVAHVVVLVPFIDWPLPPLGLLTDLLLGVRAIVPGWAILFSLAMATVLFPVQWSFAIWRFVRTLGAP